MGLEKKVVSVRLSEETIEKLKLYAEQENRNLSNIIETVLLNYIKKREKSE